MVGSVEVSSGYVMNGRRKEEEGSVVVGGRLEGRCVRRTMRNCVAVKEPDSDEEETGDGEARMAGVLARFRNSLLERTKHHLVKTALVDQLGLHPPNEMSLQSRFEFILGGMQFAVHASWGEREEDAMKLKSWAVSETYFDKIPKRRNHDITVSKLTVTKGQKGGRL